MRKKRKVKSLRGVEIHPTGSVFIRYQAAGQPCREYVGPSMTAEEAGLPGPPNRNVTIENARRLLRERRNEIRDARRNRVPWIPPKEREKEKEREALAAADAREALRFENAVERFLKECADEYSRPGAIRATFRLEKGGHTKRPGPLAAAFRGRYLDAITRADVRQYYLDRVTGEGAFEGWRKVSRRAPEAEISALGALYTFLEDEGHALENPCHRPRTRRRDGVLAPYQPKHEAVVPSPASLRAILEADPRGEGKGRGKGKPGRHLVSDHHRALWALCYYTAARPESEPCRLTHGDVEPSEGDKWGAVTYRDTKTGGDRRVLLHPDAERGGQGDHAPGTDRP